MMTNLVPNMWYAVVASHEVPAGKPIGLKRLGEEMVFWRDAQGKIVWWREYWDGLDCAGQLGIDDKAMRAIMCA